MLGLHWSTLQPNNSQRERNRTQLQGRLYIIWNPAKTNLPLASQFHHDFSREAKFDEKWNKKRRHSWEEKIFQLHETSIWKTFSPASSEDGSADGGMRRILPIQSFSLGRRPTIGSSRGRLASNWLLLISGGFYPSRYLCPVSWRSSMIKGTDRLTLLHGYPVIITLFDLIFAWSLFYYDLLVNYSEDIKITWLVRLNVVIFSPKCLKQTGLMAQL